MKPNERRGHGKMRKASTMENLTRIEYLLRVKKIVILDFFYLEKPFKKIFIYLLNYMKGISRENV